MWMHLGLLPSVGTTSGERAMPGMASRLDLTENLRLGFPKKGVLDAKAIRNDAAENPAVPVQHHRVCRASCPRADHLRADGQIQTGHSGFIEPNALQSE